ncbi:hypothetical protein ACFDTO_34290 [Microbacteriaceae bacterium 4G12]
MLEEFMSKQEMRKFYELRQQLNEACTMNEINSCKNEINKILDEVELRIEQASYSSSDSMSKLSKKVN